MKIIKTIYSLDSICDRILLNASNDMTLFSEISRSDILNIDKVLSDRVVSKISNITGIVTCSLHDFGVNLDQRLIEHWLSPIKDLRDNCYEIIKNTPKKDKARFSDEELLLNLIRRINQMFGDINSRKSLINKSWSYFKKREVENHNSLKDKNRDIVLKFSEFKILDPNEQIFTINTCSKILSSMFCNDIDGLIDILELLTKKKINRTRFVEKFKYKN